MNPNSQLATELLLVVEAAEHKAAQLRVRADAHHVPVGVLSDHRVEVLGELLDALNRVHPGLGERLQAAMYPLTPNEESPS